MAKRIDFLVKNSRKDHQRSNPGWPYTQKFEVPCNVSLYKVSCFYHQKYNFFMNLLH